MTANIAGKILETSLELFTTHGYPDTRVSEIAKQSRVTEGAVFRLFRNKETLLDQTVWCVLIGSVDPVYPPDPHSPEFPDLAKVSHALHRRMTAFFKINRPVEPN
jgi:AcrR family transcriptional regulator